MNTLPHFQAPMHWLMLTLSFSLVAGVILT